MSATGAIAALAARGLIVGQNSPPPQSPAPLQAANPLAPAIRRATVEDQDAAGRPAA